MKASQSQKVNDICSGIFWTTQTHKGGVFFASSRARLLHKARLFVCPTFNQPPVLGKKKYIQQLC